MKPQEKILRMAKRNGGHIATAEIVKESINSSYITMLLKQNKIERIALGYLCIPGTRPDEYFKVTLKCRNAVFSYATALYFHGLIEKEPDKFDVTLPLGHGGNLQKMNHLKIHYASKNTIDIGVKIMKSPYGMKVRVYDLERIVCDMIKNKKRIDPELYSKVLNDYLKSEDKNIKKLLKYARLLNIERLVNKTIKTLSKLDKQ